MSLTQEDIQQAWQAYKTERSKEARDVLIENYMPLVKAIAGRLHSRLPKEVDRDDLTSEGVFGLLETLDSYDLERGVPFETFSSQRIKGAMLDKLRSLDWVPRVVRFRHHQVEDANREFEMTHGRSPSAEEMADQMQMTTEEYLELSRGASAAGVLSLNHHYGTGEQTATASHGDLLEDKTAVDPADHMQREDIRELVTRGMSRKERLVTILYYYEEMTMKEIGAVLGLSESRVSQMHASILLRIRKLLKHRYADFAD